MKMEYKNILPHFNNIPQNSRSILRYFTDKNKIIPLASFIILLSSFNILFINNISSTSALSYQSTSKVEFNINPTVSITINGGDLSIPSLAPGDSKDSNIITVTASSNAINGYSLSSTVGSTESTSPYYNYGTELRISSSNTINKFTNLGNTTAATLSDFNNSQWGYSYSLDSGTTWVSGNTGNTTIGYGGYETTSTNITHLTSTTSGTSSMVYKIGAKADQSQIAGEYTNIINFIGIANNNPEIIYMQDATLADCGKTMVDSRDNNVYSTTNVEGTCWMTTNLNLAGDTVLSSTDTDFTSDYYPNLPNTNGWTVVDSNKLKMPQSDVSEFNDYRKAAVYNTGNHTSDCSSGCYSYYSWATATLSSSKGYNTDSPYSLCPKGWRLPTTRIGTDNTSDFRKLMIVLGGSADVQTYTDNTIPTGSAIANALLAPPLNFLSSGYCHSGACYFGVGYYWSATTSPNAATGYSLVLRLDKVYSATDYNRSNGFAIRCVKSS